MKTIFGNSHCVESALRNQNNFQSVTEAYVGKTPALKSIDAEFDTLIRDFKKNNTVDLNAHHSTKAISKLLQQQFGFAESVVSWDMTHTPNAFTMGCSLVQVSNHEKSFKLDKTKGYYDTEHCISSFVVIHAGLMTIPDVKGSMLTAILLHEVGHEFDNSPYIYLHYIALAYYSIVTFFISFLLKESGAMQKILDFQNKAISANPVISQAYQQLTKFQALWQQIYGIYRKSKIITKLVNGAVKIKTDVLGPLLAIAGAPGEFHSDEVAAMYGYSEDFANSMRFLRNTDAMIDTYASKNVVTSFAYDAFQNCFDMAILMANPLVLMDCHPSEQARIKNNIRKLKNDLAKKDYPPKMKEQIKSDLERTEKVYEDFLKCQNGEEGKIFSSIMRQINEGLIGGRSWHNLVPRVHI